MAVRAPAAIDSAAVPALSPTLWAQSNFAANALALANEQSWIKPAADDNQVSWTLARDGSLTGRVRTADGPFWLADCSLPMRAAAAMLKTTRLANPVTCFLAPFHAAAIRCLLDALQPEQATIAVIPSLHDCSIFLHCDDFSQEIAQHRLWLVAGDDWSDQIEQLLLKQIGLAIPSQFLRLNVSDEAFITQLIEQAQTAFANVTVARSNRIAALQMEAAARKPRRLCVMTPMRFRLWQDEGFTLSRSVPADALRIDSSDPSFNGPLMLAEGAIDAGILLTPNLARADLPNLVPKSIPWLSWITTDRFPAFHGAAAHDELLIADPQVQRAACAAGWPIDRVHAAGWPMLADRKSMAITEVTVLADTQLLEPPEDLENFSSHRVLWDTLRAEIADDPFIVRQIGVNEYLQRRLRRFNISSDGFAFDRFARDLVLPAYAQAIVDLMHRQKITVRLFGDGWSSIARFSPWVAGTLATRAALQHAIESAQAALHVWPTKYRHPVEMLEIPVIRPTQKRRNEANDAGNPPILAAAIEHVLRRFNDVP